MRKGLPLRPAARGEVFQTERGQGQVMHHTGAEVHHACILGARVPAGKGFLPRVYYTEPMAWHTAPRCEHVREVGAVNAAPHN